MAMQPGDAVDGTLPAPVMGSGRQRSESEDRDLFRRAGLELVGIGPGGPSSASWRPLSADVA